MTLGKKIFVTLSALVLISIAAFAVALSHDSPCTAVPPLAAGKQGMKAITRTCYGGTESLALSIVEKPVPEEGEVLVKVSAASVNPYDWHIMTGKPYLVRMSSGFGAPDYIRVGADFAGTVEAVGAGVTQYKPGDEVFGTSGGAYAEYVLARAGGSITKKAENMTFEEAAALPIAAVTALQGLRDKGKLQPGQKVLINGASGGVGTYAVQIAKALGAEVTGVCSGRNVELVRSLGADHVIDYTQDDFTLRRERYDLILDNVGNHPLLDLRNVLTPKGIVVIVSGPKTNRWIGPMMRPVKGAMLSLVYEQQFAGFVADTHEADLTMLADLARAGKLRTAIDRRYRLDELAAALDYVATGRARGKVVVGID